MSLNFFTLSPFSAPFPQRLDSLYETETPTEVTLSVKERIVILSITLFFCVVTTPLGGGIALLTSSYYFRHKNVEQINEECRPKKVLLKAFKDHGQEISVPELNAMTTPPKQPLELKLHLYEWAAQGLRPSMQDAHFHQGIEKKGLVFAIFDGHGRQGDKIANKAKDYFARELEKKLDRLSRVNHSNVGRIFQKTINTFQRTLFREDSGATALLGFIDKKTNTLFIGTLGDSEVKILRNDELLPLSPVRNWGCKKEMERCKSLRVGKQIMTPKDLLDKGEKWLKKETKHIRVANVNLSRSLGHTVTPEISKKIKMTAIQLEPGDKIVPACDGLWDFVMDEEIVKDLQKEAKNPASSLVNLSLSKQTPNSKDNVTVLVIHCKNSHRV